MIQVLVLASEGKLPGNASHVNRMKNELIQMKYELLKSDPGKT